MTISELINDLNGHLPAGMVSKWQDGLNLPVIFNGERGPRFIGWADSYKQADDCAFLARVSATYCSRAQVALPDGRMSAVFFVMHNGPSGIQ